MIERRERQEIGREVEERGEADRLDRTQQARRHHRRDRVGGVVQPVEEIEGQRDQDQAGQQREREFVHQA